MFDLFADITFEAKVHKFLDKIMSDFGDVNVCISFAHAELLL